MDYLQVGHCTDLDNGTGVSVFLFNPPAVGAYFICGSSPATRELPTLDLDANIQEINALVLCGGSAFGLGAVDGVLQFLHERNETKLMPHGGNVPPIVPAAAIYDLAIGSHSFPTPEQAYQACLDAKGNNDSNGRIGAGAGASVGKLIPDTSRMTGGLGFAEIKLNDGLIVRAYVVVNAVGDVRDETGKIIAGAKQGNGEFADCQAYLLNGEKNIDPQQSNTTLVAIFINCKFHKIELKRIAKMATAGMARAISPVFTRFDGDIVFCISTGILEYSELAVGAIAAEAVRLAIVNSVSQSRVIPKK